MEAHLQQTVLVLNRLWQPIHTCSVKRALKLLCLGHAQVVQTEGEARYQTHDIQSWLDYSHQSLPHSPHHTFIRSVHLIIQVPKIIVLALYDRLPRQEVKFTRQNIFLRDKYLCQYCGEKFPENGLNLDHVLPRHRGGQTTWENIVTSCIPCNTRKGNRLPHEASMPLLSQPRTPRWLPFFGLKEQSNDQTWNDFLSPPRTHVQLGG